MTQLLDLRGEVHSRVVRLREGATPDEVTFQAGAVFSHLSISPDRRTRVAAIAGGLFRYALP